jgi:hypothetical protein
MRLFFAFRGVFFFYHVSWSQVKSGELSSRQAQNGHIKGRDEAKTFCPVHRRLRRYLKLKLPFGGYSKAKKPSFEKSLISLYELPVNPTNAVFPLGQ